VCLFGLIDPRFSRAKFATKVTLTLVDDSRRQGVHRSVFLRYGAALWRIVRSQPNQSEVLQEATRYVTLN
jgi:hypothetical protein